jgi:AraC family transcriptional regulator of adaptative response / DNA-3-methyladenine glycosylase II
MQRLCASAQENPMTIPDGPLDTPANVPDKAPKAKKSARKIIGADGEVIVGMMHAGIYGLPSCSLRPGKSEEIRLFTTEASAKAAGLRPCKQCRPDRFYRDRNDHLDLFEELGREVEAAPANFAGVQDLVARAGLTPAQLTDLYRDHAHLTPEPWLARTKVRHAARALRETKRAIADVAAAAGLPDAERFGKTFFQHMRMTPADYRALDAGRDFSIALPPGYRPHEVLAYQSRDPASQSERSEGNRIWKALTVAEGPVVLELTLTKAAAVARIHADTTISRASTAGLHESALAVLGLVHDISAFENEHTAFVQPRRGLRVPLLPSTFDALCWGIIGQQINIRFASKLRREIVSLAGRPIGDMRAHPTPQALAGILPSDLTSRQFSRSKTQYLLDTAQAITAGALDIEALRDGSAIAAEKTLTSQRGVGVWTARYVLMRSGFADAAPVGDSGLATALQKLHQLPERPDAEHTARLMSHFAPNRSLASLHLWTMLAEGAQA